MRVRYLPNRRVPVGAVASLHPAMEFALEQVWIVYRGTLDRDPVITGGQEDAHSSGSLHFGKFPDPRLRALDFDDDGITGEQKNEIAAKLRDRLGSQFDILWEPQHLHLEYDVKHSL